MVPMASAYFSLAERQFVMHCFSTNISSMQIECLAIAKDNYSYNTCIMKSDCIIFLSLIRPVYIFAIYVIYIFYFSFTISIFIVLLLKKRQEKEEQYRSDSQDEHIQDEIMAFLIKLKTKGKKAFIQGHAFLNHRRDR